MSDRVELDGCIGAAEVPNELHFGIAGVHAGQLDRPEFFHIHAFSVFLADIPGEPSRRILCDSK
ncbi:hypothetical protein [Terripilifer ovatus]|uniref:hypothetical protein n=1 Tax=Terripilifer ovatus TaxID=3032367 RepID=UPI003AB9594F